MVCWSMGSCGASRSTLDNIASSREVSVDLRERYPKALLGIGDLRPTRWVRHGVPLQVVGRARLVEVLELGEVGVVGVPLHPRLLGYGAHGGPCRSHTLCSSTAASVILWWVCFWRCALRFISYFRAIEEIIAQICAFNLDSGVRTLPVFPAHYCVGKGEGHHVGYRRAS